MRCQSMVWSAKLLVFIVVTLAVSMLSPAQAQSPGRVMLMMTATPVTSPYYAYYVGVSKSIQSNYPDIRVTVVEPPGAVDSIRRIRERQVELGNSTSDLVYQNRLGLGPYKDKPFKDGRILWWFDYTIVQWLATKESGVKSIMDLTGKRWNPGVTAGAINSITKNIFNMLGVKPEYYEASQQDAVEAVANRRIIGLAKLGPVPDSLLLQVATMNPVEVLGLTEDQQNQVLKEIPYLVGYTIPAGAYTGTSEARGVAALIGVMTTSKFSQDLGYKVFKAMWEDGKRHWQLAYPTGANVDVPALTLKSSELLHAGAVQYLKEKGYDIPKRLIPPEYHK